MEQANNRKEIKWLLKYSLDSGRLILITVDIPTRKTCENIPGRFRRMSNTLKKLGIWRHLVSGSFLDDEGNSTFEMLLQLICEDKDNELRALSIQEALEAEFETINLEKTNDNLIEFSAFIFYRISNDKWFVRIVNFYNDKSSEEICSEHLAAKPDIACINKYFHKWGTLIGFSSNVFDLNNVNTVTGSGICISGRHREKIHAYLFDKPQKQR